MPDPIESTQPAQPLAEAAVARYRALLAKTSPSIAFAASVITSVHPTASDAEVAAIVRALITAEACEQERRADDLAAAAARMRIERSTAVRS